MPAGGIHLCVAKTVAETLNISDLDAFYLGSVAPDSWRHTSSTKEGTHFTSAENSMDYNYDLFYEKYKDNLDNEFVMGYLIHLMTDKYWKMHNLMANDGDYSEVNKACSKLINIYDIKPLVMKEVINPIEELDSAGIEMAVNYNNSVNYLDDKESKYNVTELMKNINDTSLFVLYDLVRLKNNQNHKTR